MGVGKRFGKWVTWPPSLLKSESPLGLAGPTEQGVCTLPPPPRAASITLPPAPPLPAGSVHPHSWVRKCFVLWGEAGRKKAGRQPGGSCESGAPLASTLLRGNGRRHLPFQPPASFPLTTSRTVFLARLCRRHHAMPFLCLAPSRQPPVSPRPPQNGSPWQQEPVGARRRVGPHVRGPRAYLCWAFGSTWRAGRAEAWRGQDVLETSEVARPPSRKYRSRAKTSGAVRALTPWKAPRPRTSWARRFGSVHRASGPHWPPSHRLLGEQVKLI